MKDDSIQLKSTRRAPSGFGFAADGHLEPAAEPMPYFDEPLESNDDRIELGKIVVGLIEHLLSRGPKNGWRDVVVMAWMLNRAGVEIGGSPETQVQVASMLKLSRSRITQLISQKARQRNPDFSSVLMQKLKKH